MKKITDWEHHDCRRCGKGFDFSVTLEGSTYPGVCKALGFCSPECRAAYYADNPPGLRERWSIFLPSLVYWFTKLVFWVLVVGLILGILSRWIDFPALFAPEN